MTHRFMSVPSLGRASLLRELSLPSVCIDERLQLLRRSVKRSFGSIRACQFTSVSWLITMTTSHQQLLLRSLGFKDVDSIEMDNAEHCKRVVAWLERSKIREYATEDRGPISDTTSPSWTDAFAKYLSDLEPPCPYDPMDNTLQSKIMDWLLHRAVSLIHEDKEKVKPAPGTGNAGQPDVHEAATVAKDPTATDMDIDSDAEAAVDTLIQQLGLQQSGASTQQKLLLIRQTLSEQVLPAWKESKLCKSRGLAPTLADASHFPLGFSTGDEKVDLGAKILRMLFIKDLRGLQTEIDDLIAQMQEYTANPRINAQLGMVGR